MRDITVVHNLEKTNLVNSVTIDDDCREEFKRKGYVKIKSLFSSDAIQALREFTDSRIKKETSGHWGNLNRVGYGIHGSLTTQILESIAFRQMLGTLLPSRVVFNQGLGFEIGAGKGQGWHYGIRSFGFTRPVDHCYTIWIPLDRVSAEEGGGLACVPMNLYSCRERLKMFLLHEQLDIKFKGPGEEEERSVPHTTKMERAAFEGVREEYDYELGDALLFSRYVWHRSSPFKTQEGRDRKRMAYVMRFLDYGARFDSDFWAAVQKNTGDSHLIGASPEGLNLENCQTGELLRERLTHHPAPL